MSLEIRHKHGVLVLKVKVIPNAGVSSLAGIHAGAIKIKINAQPEKGRANKELTDFLSNILSVKKADIGILKGETSRDKELLIENIDEKTLRRILNG
jgi:uncharacterized protein